MYVPLMELIKNGKINDTLKVRGGVRNRHQYYVFLKTKKNTVLVMDAYTYKSSLHDGEEGNIIARLTPEYVEMHFPKTPHKSHNTYRTWQFAGFCSLNLLYDVYERYIAGTSIIHTADQEFLPMPKVRFNWEGKLISKIPKSYQKKYAKWERVLKDDRNAAARARYAQSKAERTFKKHREKGTLDEWDVKNVFKLKNAQVRQQAIEAIGIEKVLAPYNVVVINKDTVDGRPYELIEIDLPSIPAGTGRHWSRESEAKKALYLKMTNPSTGEYHLEGVPRKSDNNWDHIAEETVLGALAWRDGETPRSQSNVFKKDLKEVSIDDAEDYIKPIIIT